MFLALALVLVACQPAPAEEAPAVEEPVAEEPVAEEPAEEPAAEAEPLTFGMVLVGPKNDRGWSQAHFEGGLYIEANMEGAKMIVFESLNPGDKPEATLEGVVDDMVAQGATLVITTSDAFEEDTVGVAEKYPDVVFINSSGDDVLVGGAPSNLGNTMGQMVNMKYIAGCSAALATETGQIGYLGPLINTETKREASAAYLGARYCYENYKGGDPADLKFTVTWIGFWFNIPGVTLDPTEVVTSFFDSGADVVLSGIDTSEAIDGAGQRASRGDAVWASPYGHIDGCDNAPDVCLGAAFFNWNPAYLAIAESVVAGTWEQSWDWNLPYWDDLTDLDQTNVGWSDGSAQSEELAANLDDFVAKLAAGEIDLWAGPLNLQDGTELVAEGATAEGDQIWYLSQLLEGMEGPSE
ncbi:MAG: BMP family ABC transporter substrate-binding protein [Chloroflexi bacterium]|nr:BMP family ABC transporter substrate-binding protein [Chloroflexota bacterium]